MLTLAIIPIVVGVLIALFFARDALDRRRRARIREMPAVLEGYRSMSGKGRR